MLKRWFAAFLALILVFGLAACGEKPAETGAPDQSTGESIEENGGDDDPADGRLVLKKGMTLAEAGTEVVEKVIQETAMAYYYANPNTQYDLFTANTLMSAALGSGRITSRLAPEFAYPEMKYYAVCRSFTADVYWDAFNYMIGGLNGTGCGTNIGPVVAEIGSLYASYCNTPEEKERMFKNKTEFIDCIQANMRPGDIILATPNTGQSGHVIMFLGDLFDSGIDYIIHCWPVNGGKWDPETGADGEEPFGGVTLQTAEEFIYTSKGSPNWSLVQNTMTDIIVDRFTTDEEFMNGTFSDAAITRYNKPGLQVVKDTTTTIYETILTGETLTITETLTNRSDEDYTVTVTEHLTEGVEFVKSASDGKDQGSLSNDSIVWKVKVPSYDSAQVSYTVRITAEAGTVIEFPSGTVSTLPTRPVRVKVGKSRITIDQEDALWNLTKYIPNYLNSGFMNMDFLNVVYSRIVGYDINLPKTLQEYLDKLYDVKYPPRTESTYMLVRKKEIAAEDQFLVDMEMPRFAIGKAVYLEDMINKDRSFVAKEEFFKEGDILIEMHGYNLQAAKRDDQTSFCIYLGAGKVLKHSTEGTEVTTFASTFGILPANNVSIVLRPTYYYDAE